MFYSKFTCSVCSTLQNQRAKLWSRTLLFHLMCVHKDMCLHSPCQAHLQYSPWSLRLVLEVGGSQQSCRAAGAAWTNMPRMVYPCSSRMQWWSWVQVALPRALPNLREGRTCGSCVSLSAAEWLMVGGEEVLNLFLQVKCKMVLIWAFYRLETIFSLYTVSF